MLILGIDTSTARSSVCLGGEGGLLASAALGRPQAHAEFVASGIDFCLDRAGISVDEVTGIAATLGPGLYTGMRVGIATAQALAHARGGLPVVGASSLELLAFPFRHLDPSRPVWSVVDARRRELFWARYRPGAGGVHRVGEQRVGPPDKLAAEVAEAGEGALCVGDGATAHADLLRTSGAEIASIWAGHPSAVVLVELALPRFAREDTQRPEDLRPLYLRAADARISWRNRGALRGGEPA